MDELKKKKKERKKIQSIIKMEYYSTLRKKNPAMSTNMVGSRRHYIKGNKPDTEKQMLYCITYM